MSSFTRRFSTPRPERFSWLVVAYEDASVTCIVEAATPCESYVRRLLGLPDEVPILIGRLTDQA